MKKSIKCSNCGFEGLMECWKSIENNKINCKCPNCKYTFGNYKE